MFLLSAAPEWIFWPLYINIPANMGVSFQSYCSNWLKSTKRFNDPHLGTFCSRIEVTLLGRKNPQRGLWVFTFRISITLKRRHIKQTLHKRSTVVSEPWSAAIKGCFSGIIAVTRAIGGRLWLPVFQPVLHDLTVNLSWWLNQPKKLCVKYFVTTNERRSSPVWSLFSALRLGLSGNW